MTRRKRHIFWMLFPLLCLLTVGASAAITYWRHTVPLSECSEIYRHYRKTPGIRAAYIKDMTVDDTIHFDMTLLEARDSATYVWLLRDLGQSEERIRHQMDRVNDGTNHCYTAPCNGEISCTVPGKLEVAFLHPHRPEDKTTLIIRSMHKEIELSK